MDQFKTLISNFKQLSRAKKSQVFFYLRVDDIVVYQISEKLGKVTVDFEIIHPITDSMLSSLKQIISQLLGHKLFLKSAKVFMVIDDHYLTMHRFNFTNEQLLSLHQNLDVEIDQFNDYECSVEYAPAELKDLTMVLVYLIKKSTLSHIENEFKEKRIKLSGMVSRYQSFQSLFYQGSFELDPKKPTVMVDISQTRVRLYISINNQIKMFRRMLIKLDNKLPESKQLDSVFSIITPFIENAIENYLLKYTNQAIDTIYFVSDSVFLSDKIKKYKIKNINVSLLPIKAELFSFKKVTRKVTYLFTHAYYLSNRSKASTFNLLPVLKRFESKMKLVISIVFFLLLLGIVMMNASQYFLLQRQYKSLIKNQSENSSLNLQKRRELIELRNRIDQQKKVIDYADLTTISLQSSIRIDRFLYDLISITSEDISFQTLSIGSDRISIKGKSSSLNGNYSFYLFLQELENFPNFDRVRYNLGLGSDPSASSFSLEAFFKTDD